ncbi:FMN-binding protein [Paractinoplanes globisporus]|uniref:FMN-binding protein n=1 Tax=Paractinoplanes globisporus TaxID=113565 RepID=A0ABW6W838_9ACTN|nr:FMN-binding protein [Actinoplanes globisporus]
MRRVTLWIVSTIAAVVLLLSYRTSLGGGNAAAGTAVILAPSASGPGGRDLTVNGSVVRTRWGPVQVQVKINNHKIVDVRALRYPDGNDRDAEINGYALPQLRAEVLSAQSAHVDVVGGATYTSGGYLKSLQSALDAAHFA